MRGSQDWCLSFIAIRIALEKGPWPCGFGSIDERTLESIPEDAEVVDSALCVTGESRMLDKRVMAFL